MARSRRSVIGRPGIPPFARGGRRSSVRDLTTRVLLIVMGAGNAVVGLWASLAPRSFYDDFPGAGRQWVAVDGPYNEHLVRDVAVLELALLAVVVAAWVRP